MIRFLFLTGILWVCAGCAAEYGMQVNGTAATGQPAGSRYLLLPADNNVGLSDREFVEFSRYVDGLLKGHSFKKVQNIDEADIIIMFSYGSGEKQRRHYSYSGSAPVDSEYSSPAIFGAAAGTGSAVEFTRYIRLEAFDSEEFRTSGQRAPLWQTSVVSTGLTADLHGVMPFMAAAASGYVARDTGHSINIVMRENDEAVSRLKGWANRVPKDLNQRSGFETGNPSRQQ